MTINIPPPVAFGFFFGLCKRLWLLFRNIDNGYIDANDVNDTKMTLINRLFEQYQKFDLSLDEFHFCVGGIESNNDLLNPLEFELDEFAYIIHVRNCYLLTAFND